MRINSFVESAELKKDIATLSSEESHHLARVLRVQPGQEMTLFDGQGGVAEGIIDAVSKTAVEVNVSKRWAEPKPAVEIDLIQAVPKLDRWDLVLQKAVELGATTIRPVITQHTEFKPHPKKQDRWQKIVLNAAQQCEVRWLPTLKSLEKWPAILPLLSAYDVVIIGSLFDHPKLFRELDLSGKKKIALLIGPEGDFTEEEVESAISAGAIPVSFGDRILRTETAAIFGLSVLAYELL